VQKGSLRPQTIVVRCELLLRQNQVNVNCKGKGNGKVVPVLLFLTLHHALKAYWGGS
jgi:hypothetical protein